MSKEENEFKLKQLEKEEKEKKEKEQIVMIIGVLIIIGLVGTWVQNNWDDILGVLKTILIILGILVVVLFLSGVNPFSRLFWKRWYVRKQHRDIIQLTKGVPDEELPEHIRREKVLIEGEYNRKIAKLDDKRFLF